MRLLWLADRLRAAGLTVVEVAGWRTHGSEAWAPTGVIFHATADKARTAEGDRLDDAGAIGVIRNGRPGLDGPIASAYVNREGTWFIIASGRCNTARVGWSGPLKGLGNSRIIGVEAENDNRGEPWPSEQLRSLRTGFRVILAGIGQPVSRLAGHYEHQPSPGPPGETSTKTDPHGINMQAFRDWVADGEDDDMALTDIVPGTATNPDHPQGRTAAQVLGEIWSMLYKGERLGGAQTAGGRPIVNLLQQFVDVDGALARIEARLADLAATDPSAPAGAVTLDQAREAVRQEVRAIFADAGAP